MALQPNFNICSAKGCNKLIFNETTGIYDADLNTGGYGTPNIAVGDVVETNIIITLPDGETSITITDPVGLPTSDDSLEYEIPYSTLNEDWTTVQDGLYIIEYTIEDEEGIIYSSGTKYFLITCNLDCCVSKLFAKIATSTDCSCDSTVIKNALYASALLEGLKASAGCGDTTAIENLITKLNKICGISDSNCGCN